MNKPLFSSEKIQNKILQLFLSGKTLTTLEGNLLANTVDYRKNISTLRQKGYRILDKWDVNPNNNKRFKRYWLDPEYIKSITQ